MNYKESYFNGSWGTTGNVLCTPSNVPIISDQSEQKLHRLWQMHGQCEVWSFRKKSLQLKPRYMRKGTFSPSKVPLILTDFNKTCTFVTQVWSSSEIPSRGAEIQAKRSLVFQVKYPYILIDCNQTFALCSVCMESKRYHGNPCNRSLDTGENHVVLPLMCAKYCLQECIQYTCTYYYRRHLSMCEVFTPLTHRCVRLFLHDFVDIKGQWRMSVDFRETSLIFFPADNTFHLYLFSVVQRCE